LLRVVKFGILGPVEVQSEGEGLPLGGPKQRALVALLVLHANEVVSRDRLIDGLWGERPPPSAAHTLENYVSRLRKALGDGRIVTRTPGYQLRADPAEVDLCRFQLGVEQGIRLLAAGRKQEAADTLAGALGLWRGPALADVLDAPFAGVEAERLEDARVAALERRLEADLAAGRSADRVGELEALVRRYPLREQLVYLLMLALYRSGRQTAALETFRQARQRLAGELGLEPGPRLQTLQRQILAHDPGLDTPATDPAGSDPPLVDATTAPVVGQSRSGRRSRRVLYTAAGLVAAAGIVGLVLGWPRSGSSSSKAGGPSDSSQVVMLSGSGAVSGRAELAAAPAAAAAGSRSVWLPEPDAETVTRVDVASGNVVDRIPVPGGVGAVAVGGGAVWALAVRGGTALRIDPATARITQRIGLGGARASALAFGPGSLWVADAADSALIEVDPENGVVRRTLQLGLRPTALAPGRRRIWVADYDAGTVADVDTRSGQTVATIHVGNGPGALAVGAGAVWVANTLDSTVSRIDPARDIVVATVAVGSGPAALAVADGSVWTADRYSARLSRIDPRSNLVTRTVTVGGEPTTLVAAGGKLWLGLQPHAASGGGVLHMLSTASYTIDPALQHSVPAVWTTGLTTDGLVSYNHVGGPDGLQLVPDLALALPAATDGGRTYTFRLRPGIRYSDGRVVRASDFRRAFRRLFHAFALNADSFRGIIGATDCVARRGRCELSRGIVTDDATGTVTFHLRAPDPNFLTTLTYGSLAAPVPLGTPLHAIGFHPIPGTGPYKIARANRRETVYVRNPYFREWSHAAQPAGNPDRIVTRYGLSVEREVRAIVNGQADFMFDAVAARMLPELQRDHARQLHSYASPETDFLQFNTALAPFDDVRVRQAVNLALDRRRATRLYGGSFVATPTCQVLPPGVPGYRRYCPYTTNPSAGGTWTAPDLARARRLVAKSGTRGARVTVWGWKDDCCIQAPVVEYIARLLRQLGYRANTSYVTHAYLDHPPPSVFKAIQVIPTGWEDPTADNFFATWFACAAAGNHGWFCHPDIDRQIREARTLAASDPRAAMARWSRIDRQLVDQAATVPLFNERWVEFVSARVRNYQHNPNWGLLPAQLSLR
jgi:YVTN family beta-propeller protein